MQNVQNITVTNKGAYIFNFSVQWLSASGKWTISDWNSGNFAVTESRTTPALDEIGVPSDAIAITVYGHALAGNFGQGAPLVKFEKNNRTATYEAVGTTHIGFAINLIEEGPTAIPPANFPSTIAITQKPFKNWALDIDIPNLWTCAPQTAEDVVTVCNWAKMQGYKVRPTGIKHTWSPITVTPNTTSNTKVMLVDTTQYLNNMEFIPANSQQAARVKVGTGATMEALLTFLEYQPSGQGSAPGYSFPNTPAPGHLTVGGVLAINGHGTAIRTQPQDNFNASYGSMSNQILEFTAVVTNPNSATPNDYSLRTFKRGEGDDKAFLTHLGKAFIVEVVLQVIDNYNLRCESRMDLPWQTLFQAPTPTTPDPTNSFAQFMNTCGRIEIIWFPFSTNPWLHLWTVSPQKPAQSRKVNSPYNYPFADNVPTAVTTLLKSTIGTGGFLSGLTPEFGKLMASVTEMGFKGKDILGLPVYPPSADIWGPSKNTLLYIQDTTLRVTANGYAIHINRKNIQQAVSDVAFKFNQMLTDYAARGEYPINSPLEIRVTELDDPSHVSASTGHQAQSPVISSLSKDITDNANQWDLALWVDVLTLPGTPLDNQFYREFEEWLLQRFTGATGKVMPEWSKGWAYTDDEGPWTNANVMAHIRQSFTAGRDTTNNWDYEVDTLHTYDQHQLFSNPLLDILFTQQ